MNNQLSELTKPLSKDDIEIRVGVCSKKGASFLLYKTARVDTKRFNTVFGLNWKREHRVESGYHVCKISVFNEDTKEWICREDVGIESNTQKEKGAFSDAFKRAGFSFGVGIELYEAPLIFIKGITTEDEKTKKIALTDLFYTNNLEIQKYDYSVENGLQVEIYNKKDKTIVFTNFKNSNAYSQSKASVEQKSEVSHKVDFEQIKQNLLGSENIKQLQENWTYAYQRKNLLTENQNKELLNIKESIKLELAI